MALGSPEGFDGGPFDNETRANKPGAGCSSFHQRVQRTPGWDDGGDDDGHSVRGVNHQNDSVASPSLDILTRDYGQDGSNGMVCKPTEVETVASAPTTEEDGFRGRMERGSTSGGKGGAGTKEEARDIGASKTTGKAKEGGTQTRDHVAGIQSLVSKARYAAEEARSGNAHKCCDAVLPLALSGEAHNMSFGAAAKAVVLVSGSTRLMVSRCNATPLKEVLLADCSSLYSSKYSEIAGRPVTNMEWRISHKQRLDGINHAAGKTCLKRRLTVLG